MALSLDREAFIDIITDGQGDTGAAMLPPPEGVSWRRRPSPEYAATGETRRTLVRDAQLMTDWSSVLASANPLRKG